MRINNPRLFNGDLLATYRKIATLLGLQDVGNGQGVSGLLSASIVPISGITAVDNLYPIFGDTIKIDTAEGAKTVKEAIADAAATAAYDANVSGKADEAITVEYSSGFYDVASNTGLSEQFTIGLKLANGEQVLSQTSDGLATTIELKKVKTEAGFAATYELQGIGGTKLGDAINIPQDQMLSGVEFVQGSGSGDDALRFTFYVIDPTGTAPSTQVLDVPLSGLFDEYTPGAGISLSATATGIEIAGVVDPGADNEFLSIGTKGFKVSGVTNAINAASGYALDQAKAYTDDAISGVNDDIEYVSGVVDAVSGVLSGAIDGVIVSGTAPESAASFNRFYVDGNQAAYIIPANSTAPISISKGTTDSITSGVTDGALLAEAAAVTGYVNTYDTNVVQPAITTINAALDKKSELYTTSKTFGGATTATVPGRVVAVYDNADEQCYPYIKYTAGNPGTSLLSADLTGTETFTVVYATIVNAEA